MVSQKVLFTGDSIWIPKSFSFFRGKELYLVKEEELIYPCYFCFERKEQLLNHFPQISYYTSRVNNKGKWRLCPDLSTIVEDLNLVKNCQVKLTHFGLEAFTIRNSASLNTTRVLKKDFLTKQEKETQNYNL